ncbi:MAG TPA: Ig-like domain repeat protein [Acidobacteriaceae bacterium]|nr:Ig-like domain repeat protein [Acidobacteriaceae bacterium]
MEFTANVRRLAHTALLLLVGILSVCGVAGAQQQLVASGSIIPITHSNQYCQVYKIVNAPNGDTVFLDVCGGGGYGSLYQLKKGSTTIQTIAASIDSAGTYWNEYLAIDAVGTLYITDRYSGSSHIYRVPYNPKDGSWDFSASVDNWYPTLNGGFNNKGTIGVAFWDSPKRDGSGILYVSEQNAYAIMAIPVNADGTVPTFPSGPNAGQPQFQYLVNGLTSVVMPMDTDVNGNLYFIENPYVGSSSRATGIFFIPASQIQSCMAKSASGSSDPTVSCIAGTESALARVDPGNTEKFNGITHDAAGNLYVGDSSDSYGGTRNGLLMIPNVSGSPVGVTASSFNFSAAQYLAPVAINANPAIDYRGFYWLPTGTASNFSPAGSSGIPGTGNFVAYQPGTANLGTSPLGTPTATDVVFYTFSGSVTPASIGLSQPGGGTEFSTTTTNPYPPTSGTTPAVPCTAGTTYLAYSSCQYWLTFNPQGANAVGSVSGQLALLDSKNNPIPGSTTYLNGVGQGPEVSLLIPAQQTPLSTGLTTPAEVAGDTLGNAYVADPGQGKVLTFAANATAAGAGTSVGTGLTAPTGVALDGAGDVFIGDSGKIIKIPSVNGKLNPAGQAVLVSGLGPNLNLAADSTGAVYAADPNNARVVRVFNPQGSLALPGVNTVGTGFTKPTAVAVDSAGDVFVADGTNLVEVNYWGGQTTITSSLQAPVTGLAVEPSGSVEVAQNGGILRIPLESGGLNFNDAAAIDAGGVTAPSGIGLDSLGNFYVTATSYNVSTVASSGAVSTPVTTPNVLLLSGALANFGIVSQQTPSNPLDVNVYNIGNAPLSLTAAPAFSGPNAADYSIQSDGQNPCDTSGATTVAGGTACQLGVTVSANGLGLTQATMTVATNALNAPTTSATLEGYSSNLLCKTQTSIALAPASGLVYPGATKITSTTTAADPTCSPGNAPQGGNLVLTLAPQAKGAAPSTQTVQLPASGQYTFSLTGLSGGTYVIYTSYRGDVVFGGSSSTRTFSVAVAQATPKITLGTPAGFTAINGVYYIGQGKNATLTANVSSSAGKPSGSVSFLNGSSLADSKQGPITLDASGNATFSTTNLAAGPNPSNLGQVYNLTAVYSGDTNFATVKSTAVTVEIVPPSALIQANPTSISTPAGTPVTTQLTVVPLNGYSPQLGAQLYCDSTTLPQYAECEFDVPKLDIRGANGASVISNLTITSNLAVTLSEVRSTRSTIAFAGLFGVGLLGLGFRRRLKLNGMVLSVLCFLLLGGAVTGLTGCTNSGYTQTPPPIHNVTPSGTYNVSVYTIDLQSNQRTSLPFTVSVTIQ